MHTFALLQLDDQTFFVCKCWCLRGDHTEGRDSSLYRLGSLRIIWIWCCTPSWHFASVAWRRIWRLEIFQPLTNHSLFWSSSQGSQLSLPSHLVLMNCLFDCCQASRCLLHLQCHRDCKLRQVFHTFLESYLSGKGLFSVHWRQREFAVLRECADIWRSEWSCGR